MRLRTTAGPYAGQIRDYTFRAAQAALANGMAEPVEDGAAQEQTRPPSRTSASVPLSDGGSGASMSVSSDRPSGRRGRKE